MPMPTSPTPCREHVAAMVACKSLQEAREHVRQLKDSGVVAALAAGATSPSAEGGAAVLAGADDDVDSEQPGSKRKRASPGVAAAEEEGEKEAGSGEEKNAEGEEREEGSSGGSKEEQELSSSSEASGDDEEDVLRVEPVPKRARGGMPGRGRGRGAAAPPPGVPKAARGGGRAGFHSVVASPPGWACQVLISHSKLAQKYREEGERGVERWGGVAGATRTAAWRRGSGQWAAAEGVHETLKAGASCLARCFWGCEAQCFSMSAVSFAPSVHEA